MTRQTWTAAVCALLFVACAAVIAMVPVDYVIYSPGASYDLLGREGDVDTVTVTGADTFETTGQLHMTTVAITRADARVGLPEVLFAHWVSDRSVFPREAVYPAGASSTDVRARDVQLMTSAQSDAAAAALREAGVEVRTLPVITSVASAGPSVDLLFPGDFVLEVDGTPTTTVEQVRAGISAHGIGEVVTLTVLRDRQVFEVSVETEASRTDPGTPVAGLNLTMGFSYEPRVSFALEQGVGGSSAGLMMALAVYDRITAEPLVGAGMVVAGTGAIDGAGDVGPVGGVDEKIAAARRVSATAFMLPSGNCRDVGPDPRVRLVPVESLEEAVTALRMLADPASEGLVKGCS